jgi:hypothetical protein
VPAGPAFAARLFTGGGQEPDLFRLGNQFLAEVEDAVGISYP